MSRGVERIEAERLELPAHDVDRHGGLEAAAVAAAAPGSGGVDLGVPDLAGHAVGSAVQLTVEDERGADAVRGLDVDEVA